VAPLAAVIDVSPRQLEFGAPTLGEEATRNVVVTNRGSATLEVHAV
jgi:hypothetical protein